jgi:hypothetical protein
LEKELGGPQELLVLPLLLLEQVPLLEQVLLQAQVLLRNVQVQVPLYRYG